MKPPLQLLPFFASPLLGHGDLGQTEICGLGASLIPAGGPVCLADSRHLACQDGNCDGPKQYVWTHSSPCFQGAGADEPICAFTDTNFAEGRGISLVTTARRASYLATTPPLTDPDVVKGINQDLNRTIRARYEMREIPGKGMGLIATEHIMRGDPIMANTASLMIDYRAFNELSRPEYTGLQAHAVANLDRAHQTILLNLSSHDPAAAQTLPLTDLIDKIAATNGFDIDPSDDDPDQHNSYFVLFPEIARMNHDCRPNAEYLFDHATLSQSIHAARDISPGEELTLSYINPLMTRAQRMAKLKKNWGFDCSCPSCSVENKSRAEESDARIRQIGMIKGEMGDWGGGSRASPEMAELLVALYEMERLWGSLYEAYTLAALEYNAVGDAWTAVKYGRMGVEWAIPMVGEGDDDVTELRALVEDPWGHWSWERRVSGQEGK